MNMKAYVVHYSDLGTDSWGEGMYALVGGNDKVYYKRWCSSRAFANHDLTKGVEHILKDNGITEVWSNGVLVWSEGALVKEARIAFLAANEEYELIHSDAR